MTGVHSLADLTWTQHGNDAIVMLASGDGLFLANVAADSLTEDDLLFEQVAVNQGPTDIGLSNTTVEENVAVDTVIGSLAASDPDLDETFTYSLLDDAGGRFAIAGDTIVAAGELDYELSLAHDVTVRVTDSGGNVFDKTFTIDVTDVDEAAIPDDGAAGVLLGGDGMDTLTSALGSDVMTGGADGDLFVFQAIQSQAGDIDTITDFVVGQDYLQLDGLAVTEQTEYDLDGDAVLDTSLTLDDGAIIQLISVSNVSQWELMQ
jgi:Ca2+-binding RTX toxin-like protein